MSVATATFMVALLAGSMLATQPLRAVPEDYAVIDAFLSSFLAEADTDGASSGYVTLKYVVSDRTIVLPRKFLQFATHEFPGGRQQADRIRDLSRQVVYSDLYRRAGARSRLEEWVCPPHFVLAEDELLPRETLMENATFEKRFSPAEGVIYVSLPGYSSDGSFALMYAEMYFSLWQTTRLYLFRKHHDRWDVRWVGTITEQGE